MMMDDTFDLSSMSSIKAATSYTSNSLHDAVKLRIGKQGGLAANTPQTIPHFFRECCRKYAQLPALVFETKANNATTTSTTSTNTGQQTAATTATTTTTSTWTTLTYADYERHVQQAALVLLHVGLQPRSSVGILSFNCPEWFYTELGALRAGGVVAGIYPSNSAEAVYHVLDTSEATVCIVDDAAQMAKVRAMKSRLPRLRAVLQLHGPYAEFVGVDEGYYRWDNLANMKFGEELQEELVRRERFVGANECAILIYTSGTVGMPKAVMLSHDGVIHDAKAIAAILPDVQQGNESCVTYLPLNHIAAQLFDIFITLVCGGCIYFADSNALKGTLGRTLSKARPTRMFGVPRIFEKMQESLVAMEANSSSLSRYIMHKSREIVEGYYMDILENKKPSSLKYWFATKITRQIRVALGLDQCKSYFIGGAPVTVELKRFFLSLDMPLTEVYGLSEAGGATNLSNEMSNLKSAGAALEGIEFKIYNPDENGQGEICLRGRTTFMGYLNEMEKTKEVMKEDGWLHSGDVGYLDAEGSLIVSGRIKELIITAGGENIPPVYVESLIKRELPGIRHATLVGDCKKYLAILLTIKTHMDSETGLPLDTLHPEALDWLKSLGLNYTHLSQVLNIPKDIKDLDASNVVVNPHPKVLDAIQEGIKRANMHSISHAQKVQKFTLLPHDYSVATGELGETLKVRRNIILQKYANVIEQMYK